MKYLLLVTLMMSSTTTVFAEAKRKISGSYFYVCNIERQASDNKRFNEDFPFILKESMDDDVIVLKSKRWNKVSLELKKGVELELSIEEKMIGIEKTKLTKKITPENFSFSTPALISEKYELVAGDKKVTYFLQCQ